MRFIIFLLFPVLAYSKPVKIGIIDTGFNISVKLCDSNSYLNVFDDFSDKDFLGHGTAVLSLIKNNLVVEHCFVLVRWAPTKSKADMQKIVKGLEFLANKNVDIINLSLGGEGKNQEEERLVNKIINNGTLIVVAAGNNNKNLGIECNFFPTCYNDKIIVVGALEKGYNHGIVIDMEESPTALLYSDRDKVCKIDYGTSYAAPRATAKIANMLGESRE